MTILPYFSAQKYHSSSSFFPLCCWFFNASLFFSSSSSFLVLRFSSLLLVLQSESSDNKGFSPATGGNNISWMLPYWTTASAAAFIFWGFGLLLLNFHGLFEYFVFSSLIVINLRRNDFFFYKFGFMFNACDLTAKS